MRILIAALLGGVVVFVWGFVSHVVLPVGDMGMRQPANEDVVLEAIKTGLGAEGVYYLPSIAPEKMADEAASKAWAEKSKASPYVFIVHRSGGYDPTDMGPNLATEFVTNVLSALVAAVVAASLSLGFGGRVLMITGMGLFAFLSVNVPLWNWYHFPTDFTAGQFIGHVVGWMLGGIAIAWWLGRGKR